MKEQKYFYNQLKTLNACDPALEWVGDKSLHEAWNTCERGDWMLWLAAMVEIDRKVLVLATCECARLFLHFFPEGENRPRKAIEIAESWAKGKASLSKVNTAEQECWDYYWAAPRGAPLDQRAAPLARRVAAAARAAAAVARGAAARRARAASAAQAAEYNPKKSADIIRKHISANDICRALG